MYKRKHFNELSSRIMDPRDKFHPKHSLVVGSGGITLEEFLFWDIYNLLEP